MRNYATQVPDIGDSLCAVVDFDGSDAALKAVRELKEKYNEKVAEGREKVEDMKSLAREKRDDMKEKYDDWKKK